MKLSESLNANLSGYIPVESPITNVQRPNLDESLQPRYNPMLRCPIPPVSFNPDTSRAFYMGDKVPQFRILTPNSQTSQSNSGTTINNVNVTSSGTGGGGSTTATLAVKNASITTPVLLPGEPFQTSLELGKAFQLLMLTTNFGARVEVYGTESAQSNDLGRALDVTPLPGTTQDLITDIVLDSFPLAWTWQNRIGANGNSPQSTLAYITITNEDASAQSITASFSYIPLVS